jgi:hypothetical protein
MQILDIEVNGQGRRTDEVAEHDSQMTSLSDAWVGQGWRQGDAA